MKTIEVKYLGELRTQAIHLASGKEIITDAPKDNKGKGEYFSPTDLVATAFASCILTILGIGAETYNYDLTNTKVEVSKIMDANPRKIKEIITKFIFPDIQYSEKQKKAIIQIAKTCPVALSLNNDIKRTIILVFNDETINI